jgi:hypothetical protein
VVKTARTTDDKDKPDRIVQVRDIGQSAFFNWKPQTVPGSGTTRTSGVRGFGRAGKERGVGRGE